ncbi:E3 ubiquitin-protein ligase TRIM [Acrasis kona]|uniref:E3 ubiquitin-protein ligase TRIM n=1 Tax=Acrasis kona TaxID=1008807 RepID=A0AAW2ZGD9_9EUKA
MSGEGCTTCPHCYCLLEEPTRLICGHCMCRNCVGEVTAVQRYSNVIADTTKATIKCPVCASNTKLDTSKEISELPVDVTAKKEVSNLRFNSLLKCVSKKCDSDASHYCKECGKQMCSKCFDTFHDFFEGRHTKLPIQARPETNQTCIDHQEPFQVFCLTCNLPLCVICASVEKTHSTHSVLSLKTYSQNCCTELKKDADELRRRAERIKETKKELREGVMRVEEAHEVTITDIQQNFDKLYKALDERKNQLTRKAERIKEKKCKNFYSQKKSIDEITNRIEHLANICDSQTSAELASTIKIAVLKQRTTAFLRNLGEVSSTPLSETPVRRQFDDAKITKLIENFGSIVMGDVPCRVEKITAVVDKDNKVMLTWVPARDNGSSINRYVVRRQSVDKKDGTVIYDGPKCGLMLDDLQVGQHKFIVQAINDVGEGMTSDPSETVIIKGSSISVNAKFQPIPEGFSCADGIILCKNRNYFEYWGTVTCDYVMAEPKLYYFEIEIMRSYNNDIMIGVLDKSRMNNLAKLGNGDNSISSWGLYCKNGRLRHNNIKSTYMHKQSDSFNVVGVVVDLTNVEAGKLYFLVDGRPMGLAYNNLKPPLSPAVSLKKKNDCVRFVQNAKLSVKQWDRKLSSAGIIDNFQFPNK